MAPDTEDHSKRERPSAEAASPEVNQSGTTVVRKGRRSERSGGIRHASYSSQAEQAPLRMEAQRPRPGMKSESLPDSDKDSTGRLNICTGWTKTDRRGLAVIPLPESFEDQNRDFRYQLTVIGQFAQAIVVSEVANHSFTIQTDQSEVRVSWEVIGIPRDSRDTAHRAHSENSTLPPESGPRVDQESPGTHARILGSPQTSFTNWTPSLASSIPGRSD